MKTWQLGNAVALNQKYPYTYFIPGAQLIHRLQAGDLVKLVFLSALPEEPSLPHAERMWVKIVERDGDHFKGCLDNEPHYFKDLKIGTEIIFSKEHICSTSLEDEIVEELEDQCLHSMVVISNDVLARNEFNFILRNICTNVRDTGWVFFSGYEDETTNANAANFRVMPLGIILNIDASVVPLINTTPPCAYQRNPATRQFEIVTDFEHENYYDKRQ